MNTVEQEKAIQGDKMAEALGLKKAEPTFSHPEGFNPPRWLLGKEYATKTAIGVYETVVRIAEEAKVKVDSVETAAGSPSRYEKSVGDYPDGALP